MSKKTAFLQSEGGFAHIYNRGVMFGRLFFEESDYRRFIDLMQEALNPSLVLLHAYCLMPNHFHFVIQQLKQYGTSLFVKAVCDPYAKMMNKILYRKGHFFQGDYGIRPVEDPNHLLYLSRYVHLNPVAGRLVSQPDEWAYSSCRGYFGGPISAQVTTSTIVNLAGGKEAYRRYVLGEEPRCGEGVRKILWDLELP